MEVQDRDITIDLGQGGAEIGVVLSDQMFICQSGLFGPCGPCANKPVRTFFRQRVLNRNGAFCGGAPMVPEGPVIEGAPAVIAPAAPVATRRNSRRPVSTSSMGEFCSMNVLLR